jgi:hypothetical protein
MMTSFNAVLGLPDDVLIVDTDTHLTEPRDLWTSRAPRKYADRVPRVEHIDGRDMWVFDGTVLGMAGTSSAVDRNGTKKFGMSFVGDGFDEIHKRGTSPLVSRHGRPRHLGADRLPEHRRLRRAKFIEIDDEDLRLTAVQIFNDASAEMQETSGNRMFGMAITRGGTSTPRSPRSVAPPPWACAASTPAPVRTCTGSRSRRVALGSHVGHVRSSACPSTSTSAPAPTRCRGSAHRPGRRTISTTSSRSAPR